MLVAYFANQELDVFVFVAMAVKKFQAATAVTGSTHSCDCSILQLTVPTLCSQWHNIQNIMQEGTAYMLI